MLAIVVYTQNTICGLAVGENHNMSNFLEYIYIKAWIINSHPNNDICMS